MQPITKRFIVVLGSLLLVFGAIFGWDFVRGLFMKKYFASFTPPPVTVSAEPAMLRAWQPTLTTVGTLTAVHGVNISSEVSGVIKQVRFQSGQRVEKDQLLIQLDDTSDVADLNNSAAQLKLQQADYQRKTLLFKEHAVAKVDMDQAAALLDQAKAAVAKAQNMIEKKTIRAPFAGRIGISSMNVGQYVAPGQGLVTLQSIDPLYVQFSFPEQNLSALQVGQMLQIHVDNQPNKTFSGKITAIDSKVDEATRSILVQGVVSNPEQALFPGTFAEIQVLLPTQDKVVTVPQTAVTFTLYGDSIFVLTKESLSKDQKVQKDTKPEQIVYSAESRAVVTGERQAGWVVVKSGLKAGELVVTSGQLKLQKSARVVINNSVKLD